MKILDAYISLGEYTHSFVICTDDGWSYHTNIYYTGIKPPPIDILTLKGRQKLWILNKIAGTKDIGEFPRA